MGSGSSSSSTITADAQLGDTTGDSDSSMRRALIRRQTTTSTGVDVSAGGTVTNTGDVTNAPGASTYRSLARISSF